MPKINVSKDHNLDRDELNKRVDSYLCKLRDDKMKMMNFDFTWNGNNVNLKGNGFSGTVTLTDTKADIFLDLKMMLAPFKGKVKEQLQRGLDKYLG